MGWHGHPPSSGILIIMTIKNICEGARMEMSPEREGETGRQGRPPRNLEILKYEYVSKNIDVGA